MIGYRKHGGPWRNRIYRCSRMGTGIQEGDNNDAFRARSPGSLSNTARKRATGCDGRALRWRVGTSATGRRFARASTPYGIFTTAWNPANTAAASADNTLTRSRPAVCCSSSTWRIELFPRNASFRNGDAQQPPGAIRWFRLKKSGYTRITTRILTTFRSKRRRRS